MNAYQLHEDQVIFELKSRKRNIEGDLSVLAARLNLEILLATECHVVEVDSTKEVEYCKAAIEHLAKEVNSIKSKSKTPKVKAIQSKLVHVINRAINIKANDPLLNDIADSVIEEARELTKKIEVMVSSPVDSDSGGSDGEGLLPPGSEKRKKTPTKASNPGSTETLMVPGTGGTVQYYYPGYGMISYTPPFGSAALPPSAGPASSTPGPGSNPAFPLKSPQPESGGADPQPPPFVFTFPEPKAEPLYKWQIKKFDGSAPEDAHDFLAEVEEKARTRFMPHDRLFLESAELFAGEALVWHRDAVKRVNSWVDLKRELLVAYHGHGLDSHLREQIRATKQRESQSIDVFLSKVSGMYDRLERRVDETEQLGEILRNLNSFLKDRLMMIPIHSIAELRAAARMAESGRTRMGGAPQAASPPAQSSSKVDISRAGVSAIRDSAQSEDSPKEITCFNCDSPDHGFRVCQLPLKRFCFRCGLPEVTKITCTRCHPKQKNE